MTRDITFEEMLEDRREFQRNFFDPDRMTLAERQDWLEKFILHTMDQSTSLLNELDWKEHEKGEPVDHDAVMTQIVDIQNYVLAMCVVLNVDPVEFAEVFRERSEEVNDRYETENHG